MKDFIRVFLEGIINNSKRILFASDRVTDIEMRNKILEGRVTPTDKVAEIPCSGCGGCSNACPTGAVTMLDLEEPVRIIEGMIKKQIPVLNSEKCVNCYYCHDFCPLYALFGKAGTIHPNDVGEVELDIGDLLEKPIKISDDKLTFIAQYLSDSTVLKKRGVPKIQK